MMTVEETSPNAELLTVESGVFNCSDGGGGSNSSQLDYTLADTYTVVTGSIVFLLVLPFVLFRFRFLPIGSTAAILVGAVLMVATTVLSQRDFYTILGEEGNLRTIFLLMGMMIISHYFEREGIIQSILCRLLRSNLTFPYYLCVINMLTFIVAAFFTNDAACVLLTPLILRHWQLQKRPAIELETILLAVATSANIGSVTTIFGNPQNALIASRTEEPQFLNSQLDLQRSVLYLGPPAILAFLANQAGLTAHFRIRSARQTQREEEQIDLSSPCPELTDQPPTARTRRSRAFVVLMWVVLVAMVAMFFVQTDDFRFDIGILPLGAAAVLMFLDALLNKRNPSVAIREVDWNVILMFFSIFVWLGGVNATRVPRRMWQAIGLADRRIDDVTSIAILTAFVVVGSNIFSNVPLVILVLEQLEPCREQLNLVLYLAWGSTIAGNLTLFGSVANLIVAQKSADTLHYIFTFKAYLQYGFITTLIILPVGVVIIYALLLV